MSTLGLQGPVLILAGRSARRLLEATWRESLGDSGYEYSILDFGGECTHAEIKRGKSVARDAGAKVIVGAGGGKLLDAARAVASDLKLPVVNCPTIASSDAPCSALSVIYTQEGVVDEYRIYARNPDLVLVDTAVVAQAPARFLVAGMGDALATLLEARTCVEGRVKNMRGGGSTQSALALAQLCYRTLIADGLAAKRAVEIHAVTPAMERIVEANTLLSGLGFESSGLAAAHSIHNGLTAVQATHSYLHGEKVAFGALTQLILEGKPRPEIEELLTFSCEVGLPITLAQVGLENCPAKIVAKIAERTVAQGETIHNEPFAVSSVMVADAIRSADAIGRAWLRGS
jgi:glycerol dehydrogenase